MMIPKKPKPYLLKPGSASHALICRYAKVRRLTIDDAILLRAQLGLELRQLRLGISPRKNTRRRAA